MKHHIEKIKNHILSVTPGMGVASWLAGLSAVALILFLTKSAKKIKGNGGEKNSNNEIRNSKKK
jgi:hypothetical protein